MKIIRRGNPEPVTQRIECRDCESILEVTKDDAVDQLSSYQGHFYTFECPVCKNRIRRELSFKRKTSR